MKKIYKVMVNSALVISFLLVSACASTHKKEGMGEYVDDSVVTARVKSAIFHEKTLHVAEINVETYKGVVQLSGFVSSYEDEKLAVKIAKSVSGVISVKDDMQVK